MAPRSRKQSPRKNHSSPKLGGAYQNAVAMVASAAVEVGSWTNGPAHAVFALRLEHGAITFVVHELGERHPIGGVVSSAVFETPTFALQNPLG
jgi:hypothetical protein